MTASDGIVGEFLELRADAAADLLAMQVGDFYEFFGEDAETVADELDLKLSEKSSHGSSYPMAGVPVDDLTPYLTALVERGYRVAVADQHETDSGHSRAVSRVVTPGTLLETTDAQAQYLAAVVDATAADRGSSGAPGGRYGVACADITTGKFHATTVGGDDGPAEDMLTELYRFNPVELLPGPAVRERGWLADRTEATITHHDSEAFAPGRARVQVRDQFGSERTETLEQPAVQAAGAILAYVEETGAGVLASMTRLQRHDERVALDATTQRNLELTETMRGDRDGSLVATIDHTVTSAGRRLLTEWLQRPRRSHGELERRSAVVAALTEAAIPRDRVREILDGVADLERLAARASSGTAGPRELRTAAVALRQFEALVEFVTETDRLAGTPLAEVLNRADRGETKTLADRIEAAVVEEPPGTATQGGVIQQGYDDQLDGIIERHETVQAWIDQLPDRERAAHGITHLTVDRNKTDGYYIQVGNSETDSVPDQYDRIKSLKSSERYTTPELEERERAILRLEEQRHERERSLFEALRETVAARASLLQTVGGALAECDVLASLATHAARNDWCRPELTDDRGLAVAAGRHPVVEQTTEFVPNDLRLDPDRRVLIVTGPNMSGKSTYMRQAALITLLAQIGSFVPARSARIGIVDGIYTRVGALDELADGRSTFMVEMEELSHILHSASDRSLVVLDEVGRGTATYDGISIAWAATEYLHNTVRAQTLFATHYHELTALAEHLDGVANVRVTADETDGEVTFLRMVEDGAADRSYGIHVAGLAGVPAPVVERSREVLDRLRADKAIEARGQKPQRQTRDSGRGGDSNSGDSTQGAGEVTQVVFDVGSGQFRRQDQAGGEDGQSGKTTDAADTGTGTETETETPTEEQTERLVDRYGGNPGQVLAELAEIDIAEQPPVELLKRVRQWQRTLED